MDMSHLLWGGWGPKLGCFVGNLYLLEVEGVMMWANWVKIGHFWVLNMDPRGQGDGMVPLVVPSGSATDVLCPRVTPLPSPPHASVLCL